MILGPTWMYNRKLSSQEELMRVLGLSFKTLGRVKGSELNKLGSKGIQNAASPELKEYSDYCTGQETLGTEKWFSYCQQKSQLIQVQYNISA